MDGVNPMVAALLEAKAKRRLHLAALPFAQKVAAVVKLQQMAAPILRARGKMVEPWRMEHADWAAYLQLEPARPRASGAAERRNRNGPAGADRPSPVRRS